MQRVCRCPAATRSTRLTQHPRVHTGRRSLRVAASALQQLPGGTWWAPARGQPRGICHFVGGAFAGAAPQVVYDLFLQLLSDKGYTVIATPYAISFKHADCALQLNESFRDALQRLRASSVRTQVASVPEDAPIFGVGHSNGALCHLLIGSLAPSLASANVIISYNNKQVSDAIPLPGFLEGLGPAVQVARALPPPPPPLEPFDISRVARSFVQQAAVAVPSQIIERRLLLAATPAIEQFGTVFDEVGDGITDFSPSPAESRSLISADYRVPATLLVKFTVDSIDESDEMLAILGRKYPNGVERCLLPGNHLTPCGSSIRWEVGPVYTPADAVLQGVKSRVQADVRLLVERVAAWMEGHSRAVAAAQTQAASAAAAAGIRAAASLEADLMERRAASVAPAPVPQPVTVSSR